MDRNSNGYSNVGERITFTFTVSNSGAKTLHEFCVTNSKLGAGCLGCSSPTVAPGGSFSCVISYEVLYASAVDNLSWLEAIWYN